MMPVLRRGEGDWLDTVSVVAGLPSFELNVTPRLLDALVSVRVAGLPAPDSLCWTGCDASGMSLLEDGF
jgi:hypothetical protein